MMKIEYLEPCGYCAGVKRAINIALKARKDHPKQNVFVFGMLVHNDVVMNNLDKNGIKVITDLNYISKNDILVIPAHGMSKDNVERCKKIGCTIYDATCPKVESNINLIKESKKPIIYIGYKNHSETKAAISYSNNIYTYDIDDGFNDYDKVIGSPLVINQTTISINDLKEIHKNIQTSFDNVEFLNEICNSTRIRQEGIINAGNDIDCFVIVGDKKSSNTNRLFELAKASHPDSCIILIDKTSNLDKNAITNKKHILVAGGASTSPETIDGVLNYLNKIK